MIIRRTSRDDGSVEYIRERSEVDKTVLRIASHMDMAAIDVEGQLRLGRELVTMAAIYQGENCDE